MAAAKENHGVVVLAALDVRRHPEHAAELTSQLLMGEVVRVLQSDQDAQWLRVENEADGYSGWVRSYGIRRATRARTRRWLALAKGRVSVAFAQVFADTTGPRILSPVFWNGRVIPGRKSGARRGVELPDGRRGWVDAEVIETRRARTGLLDRIEQLLGTPYHWGGRTPHGFDCSGLVQQLMAEQGVVLPRDAHDQYLATKRALDPDHLRMGDLVFFARGGTRMEHVGLVLGDGYFVHASGVVRVNSMDPANPFHDKPLARQLKAFGRTKLGTVKKSTSRPK